MAFTANDIAHMSNDDMHKVFKEVPLWKREPGELRQRFLAGTATAEETEYLRNSLATASWFDLANERNRIVKAPVIDAIRQHFPEGTIVRMKTGSQPLMVEDIRQDECVAVVWFADGQIRRDALHKSAIMIVDPEKD